MRTRILLLMLVSGPAFAQVPPLKALSGFESGGWTMTAIGSSTGGQKLCLADAAGLLTGGRPAQGCSFTAIQDDSMAGAVTFRCKGGLSGRTSVRRDAGGIYTVQAQGVEGGRPFVSKTEWRHEGRC